MSPKPVLAAVVLAAVVLVPSAGSTTPLSGTISLTDKTWYCQEPVNLSSVTVEIKTAQIDAIHLTSGCTGTIGKITVVQYHGDGIKVAPGAHDLTVGGGSIRCYAHDPGKHQDGIQAMGGQRVTFNRLDDQCLSANNSAFFVNEGLAMRELPTDVVCARCYLAGGGYPVRIALSLRSGIRNSTVCAGQFGAVRISTDVAQSPVDGGTIVLPFDASTRTCSAGGQSPATPTTTTATTTTPATTATPTTTSTTSPRAPDDGSHHGRRKHGG
jgi:hypothetical protein